MDRKEINSFVRANGGKIVTSSPDHANYTIKLTEEKFLDFREKNPLCYLVAGRYRALSKLRGFLQYVEIKQFIKIKQKRRKADEN